MVAEISLIFSDDSIRQKKPEKIRIRRHKPKVKTGCITCKIRRIKCGEEKPSCIRCTSTGRKCDGYEPLIEQGTSHYNKSTRPAFIQPSYLTYYRPSPDIPGDDHERHSFYYFRTKTVVEISGIFTSGFWEHSVLQACYFEPSVRHALLALSALHEEIHCRGQHEFRTFKMQQDGFAMQQYTKAVGLLASEIATKNEHSLQVTLMSCLIFIFLELLRDDLGRAMGHLKSGLQILQNWQESKRIKAADPKCITWASQDIDPSLVTLFRRMNISATIHGSQDGGFTSSYSIEEARNVAYSQEIFLDIEMASREMDLQLVALLHHLRRQCEEASGFDRKQYLWVNENLLHRLNLWHLSYQRFLQTSNEANTTGALLLQLHYKTISILLCSIERESEMWYDSWNQEFEEILELAEAIITQDSRFNGGYANLSTDLGVIAPLFYVSIRCRKIEYRRRAVALMELSPYREGLWHSKNSLNYAKWKIEKEEALRGYLPESETLPIHARISHEKFIGTTADEGGLLMFVEYEHGPVDANGERMVMREILPSEWADFKEMI